MYMDSQEVADSIMETPPQYHLTKKNKLFCHYYTDISDLDTYGNATKSAIKAGYSELNARKIASEMIGKPIIKAEIDRIELDITRQVDFSRADFLKILVLKAQTTRAESVQARYWDMIGRCKGYIEPEGSASLNVSLFQALDNKIDKRLQIVDTNKVIDARPEAVNPQSLETVPVPVDVVVRQDNSNVPIVLPLCEY